MLALSKYFHRTRHFPRYEDAMLCEKCDSVQPANKHGRCMHCGTILLSLAGMDRIRKRQIQYLNSRIEHLENRRGMVKGKILPWDPSIALGKKSKQSHS